MSERAEVDVLIVGAGFAGMYMLHATREAGLTARVIEAGSDVGGTWYWNRYPGARCDVPSMEYSYGFDEDLQQEWDWTERYATQPEILRYLQHVSERFDLRSGITLDTRVASAHFDDETGSWSVRTDEGESIEARFVVMATGCLSAANTPDIEGIEDFAGPVLHTGHWPKDDVDLSGLHVAVVGTGSSAVQSIPIIAEQAKHVTVFQRTATYAVPAHNRMLNEADVAEIKDDYVEFRAENRQMQTGFGARIARRDQAAFEVDDETRVAEYEHKWAEGGLPFLGSFVDLIVDPAANETAAEFVRSKIRGLVDDPELAELLSPRQIIGCKRMCVDTGYYETFNRPDVTLVDVSETPLDRLTPTGIQVGEEHFEADVVIFATGFDAMTGAIDRIDIRGRGGLALKEKWAAGPLTYLGLNVNGFPNLFMITGPGSPSVLTNMVVAIQQHVEWIRDAIVEVDAAGHRHIEADEQAEADWVTYVNDIASFTLFPGCSSWYLGANVPGKPRVFMPLPGFPDYKTKCDQVAADGYEGFTLSP